MAATATAHPPRRTWYLIGCVTALSVWVFSIALPPVLSGDSAVYLHQAQLGAMAQRTVHLGYLIPLRAAALVAVALGQGPQWGGWALSCLFACLTLGGAAWAAGREGGRWAAVLAVLLLATHPLWAPQVGAVEVYLPQLAALLWSLGAMRRGRALLAGALFGLALLISPTAWAFAPALWVVGEGRRGPITALALAGGLWLAGAGLHHEDYLWGPRGLLNAPPADVPFPRGLWRVVVASLAGWGAATPAVWVGLGVALRHGGGARAAAALVTVLGVGIVHRYSDVPAPLMAAGLVAVMAPSGMLAAFRDLMAQGRAGRWGGWALAMGLIIQGVSADTASRHGKREAQAKLGGCRALGEAMTHGDVIIGRWGDVRWGAWCLWGDPHDGRAIVAGDEPEALGAGQARRGRVFWLPLARPPSLRVLGALGPEAQLHLLAPHRPGAPSLGYASYPP